MKQQRKPRRRKKRQPAWKKALSQPEVIAAAITGCALVTVALIEWLTWRER